MTNKKFFEDEVIYEIIGGSMEVYNHLGPGLLESVYGKAMIHELRLRGLSVKTQVLVPVMYKGCCVSDDLRVDLLVEDSVLVELKAVERLMPVHFKQTRTYMKLLGKSTGLLINFDVGDFKDGYKVLRSRT
ncbi:MAG: GxxExxY protein [Bacteroidales bacterium]|nr:GxxExxY protein [Bacteroidales bacterium]